MGNNNSTQIKKQSQRKNDCRNAFNSKDGNNNFMKRQNISNNNFIKRQDQLYYDIQQTKLLIHDNKLIPYDIILNNNIDTIIFTRPGIFSLYDLSIDILKDLENIKTIIFELNFNNTLDNLPKNLENLIFKNNNKFNQPLSNLPITLKNLSLSGDFDQLLDLLPEGILKLKIPKNYNKKLNDLPSSLVYLEIGTGYMHPDTLLPGCINVIALHSHQMILFDKRFWHKMKLIDIHKSKNNNINRFCWHTDFGFFM